MGYTDAMLSKIWVVFSFWLAFSFMKAHWYYKSSVTNHPYLSAVFTLTEGVCIFLLMQFSPLYIIYFAVILLDLSWLYQITTWQNSKSKRIYLTATRMLFIALAIWCMFELANKSLHLQEVIVRIWWFALTGATVVWLGSTLGMLDKRRIHAERYYDDLRLSEDALKKAHRELEAYYQTLEEVSVLRERTRISRALHDHVGHALSASYIQLQMLQHKLTLEHSEHQDSVSFLSGFMKDTLEKTRQVVHDMGAAPLEVNQLRYALAELIGRTEKLTGASMRLVMPDWENTLHLDQDQHQCIYSTVQESITNALRHGRATDVQVVISQTPTSICIAIQDNGCGIATQATGEQNFVKGFGLNSMAARVEHLGGTLDICPTVAMGTRIMASIPKSNNNVQVGG